MFPEYRELITKLKTTDRHFSHLFDKHNNLDAKILRMEDHKEPGTPEEIETLKKELKSLVEDAEKEGVSSFDIIRYFRFISMYNKIQPVGKLTFDKNIKIKI